MGLPKKRTNSSNLVSLTSALLCSHSKDSEITSGQQQQMVFNFGTFKNEFELKRFLKISKQDKQEFVDKVQQLESRLLEHRSDIQQLANERSSVLAKDAPGTANFNTLCETLLTGNQPSYLFTELQDKNSLIQEFIQSFNRSPSQSTPIHQNKLSLERLFETKHKPALRRRPIFNNTLESNNRVRTSSKQTEEPQGGLLTKGNMNRASFSKMPVSLPNNLIFETSKFLSRDTSKQKISQFRQDYTQLQKHKLKQSATNLKNPTPRKLRPGQSDPNMRICNSSLKKKATDKGNMFSIKRINHKNILEGNANNNKLGGVANKRNKDRRLKIIRKLHSKIRFLQIGLQKKKKEDDSKQAWQGSGPSLTEECLKEENNDLLNETEEQSHLDISQETKGRSSGLSVSGVNEHDIYQINLPASHAEQEKTRHDSMKLNIQQYNQMKKIIEKDLGFESSKNLYYTDLNVLKDIIHRSQSGL